MKINNCLLLMLLMVNSYLSSANVNVGTVVPVGPLNIKVSKDFDVGATIILGVVAAAIAAKIAYDISWQRTYETTINGWYGQLHSCVTQNEIQDPEDGALKTLFSECEFDKIIQYDSWVHSSYGSWFRPWNWTAAQKNACWHVSIVGILTFYGELVSSDVEIDSALVKKVARARCGSLAVYPLIYFYEQLERHIAFININNNCASNATIKYLLQKIKPKLEHIKILLRQDKDYVDEMQLKRTHDLQEQLVQAQRASQR